MGLAFVLPGQRGTRCAAGLAAPWAWPAFGREAEAGTQRSRRGAAGSAGQRGSRRSPSPLLKAASLERCFRRNRMNQGDSNPAAVPHAAEDVQGDGRWMSQVRPGPRGPVPVPGAVGMEPRGSCLPRLPVPGGSAAPELSGSLPVAALSH